MDPHVTRLEAFIVAERDHYPGVANNLFVFALGQAARYERFVRIILVRHREIAAEWLTRTTAILLRRQSQSGTRTLTPEEISEMENHARLTTLVHLEVESFYLFAKIFLDHVAHFIEHYFGSERGISFDSHDKLAKGFERYAAAKDLEVPSEFMNGLDDLKKRIADFRDYQISHAKNPRTVRATIWGADKQPRMAMTQLYPRGVELQHEQKESESLEILMQATEKHIEGLIELIIRNRRKSRYLRERKQGAVN